MKMIKRSLISILSFLVFISLLSIPVSVSANAASSFKDTTGHWAEDAIVKWSNKGVLQGYEGAFRPNDSISRAEFATVINNILKYVETGENTFSDIQQSEWFYEAIIKLHTAGVLQGDQGKASPNKST